MALEKLIITLCKQMEAPRIKSAMWLPSDGVECAAHATTSCVLDLLHAFLTSCPSLAFSYY